MLAEDWFVRGTFGDHPHRGFETVTFVLEGSVEHRDNHGGFGVLHPGDAQWMTAGRGVIHSEEAGPDGAHSLQLWINLPAARKMVEPRYEDLRGDAMPVLTSKGARLRTFAPSVQYTPITMVEMRIDAGASAMIELRANDNAFLYLISGDAAFAKASQVVWFERRDEPGASQIAVTAESDLHAILWSGPPLREPVVARGPFVMNTAEQIRDAMFDFQLGRF